MSSEGNTNRSFNMRRIWRYLSTIECSPKKWFINSGRFDISWTTWPIFWISVNLFLQPPWILFSGLYYRLVMVKRTEVLPWAKQYNLFSKTHFAIFNSECLTFLHQNLSRDNFIGSHLMVRPVICSHWFRKIPKDLPFLHVMLLLAPPSMDLLLLNKRLFCIKQILELLYDIEFIGFSIYSANPRNCFDRKEGQLLQVQL